MHYWNRANFEGLLELSKQLDVHPNLTSLASYCRLREKGMRREAFSALEQFLALTQSIDSASARSAAVAILELNARTRDAHQFLTQPLITRFLVPTLQAWIDDEPAASTPIRWLGIVSRDNRLLERALSMCPEDIPVRLMLIDAELSVADYATHHLDESLFLGSVDEVIAALAHARDLIASAPEAPPFADRASEVRYFDAQLADWIAFSKHRAGTFPEWCAAQGREYRYPIKVYYRR
ncbi:hypothetical protein V5279_14895 [Bradyrhizobium sp. 26S5]|uniref:hypothetical protein n=1 Tax=Bradyrhizobium sp. 26S5 TaxID=3139729 RepID=UPI0030D14DA9